jgi:hypothetical protein
LSDSRTLFHVRIRPAAGIDLASLVPSASQADQMFHLKSQLFSGVALEGVWEAAVYLPEEGQPMPPMALALGFRHRGAAVSAMEQFLQELQETWPVRRSAFRVGSSDGACLLDLRLLPELAPCYVATESSLVVGWNPASLRKALDGDRGEFAKLGRTGAALIALDRFGEADQILSRALKTKPGSLPRGYPWEQLIATGTPSEDGFRLRLQLRSRTGT